MQDTSQSRLRIFYGNCGFLSNYTAYHSSVEEIFVLLPGVSSNNFSFLYNKNKKKRKRRVEKEEDDEVTSVFRHLQFYKYYKLQG